APPPPMSLEPLIAALQTFFGKFRILFKIAVIGFLALLLLIPLSMISSVLRERLERRNQTVNDITASWGHSQKIIGPILHIPYQVRSKVLRDRKVGDKTEQIEVEEISIHRAFFLPQTLSIHGTLEPRKLYRGIYDAIVYSGALTLSGTFNAPAWADLKIDPKDVLWDDAILTLGASDLRGARQQINVAFGPATFPMTPGTRTSFPNTGVSASLKGLDWSSPPFPFSIPLTFNGSNELSFAPLGVDNQVSLSSPWPDPSFRGAFLPATRDITSRGFTADWNISYYGRTYPQQWIDRAPVNADAINASLFGLEFVAPIDFYRAVERATKYGFLFIVLVFTAFFLFEILSRLLIHPFQYILVGAALCLFYLALLSLSEFLRLGWAYLLAAAASWTMITLYSWSVLKSGPRTGIIALLLGLIYTVLYVLLQLQDFALLVGTIALFLALAAVMYTTRNLDWHRPNPQP
ncbi:MAG: cell envelope integrity protein CreD, partial [Verrucomicrobiia bacterium]